MARYLTRRSHAGSAPRRAGLVVPAVALVAVAFALVGCNLDAPTQPDAGLTGTNPNQDFTFNGTITLTRSASIIPADDLATVTITAEVRNAAGSPVQNLTPVTFSTDLGQLVLEDGTGAAATQVGTFNGLASVRVASLNRAFGVANITARVGDQTRTIEVELEVVPIEGSVTLSFGDGSTTLDGTVTPAVPFRTPLLAIASGAEGDSLAGVGVRFRIIEDDSTGSGRGPARFEGFAETFTSTEGEATNQLIVRGAGRVVVVADLLDPNTDEVVATSNQIILVTAEAPDALVITLGIGDESGLSATGESPFTAVLVATVTQAGEPVASGVVEFEVTGSTGGTVTLSNGLALQEVVTDGTGRAVSGATASPAGANGTIIARLLDGPGGATLATSNIVLIAAEGP